MLIVSSLPLPATTKSKRASTSGVGGRSERGTPRDNAIKNGMRHEGLRVVQFANEAFKDVLNKHAQSTGMASSRESVDKLPKRKGLKQRKSG
jgi:hypothetical protein